MKRHCRQQAPEHFIQFLRDPLRGSPSSTLPSKEISLRDAVVENCPFVKRTLGPSGRPVFQKERFPQQWRELWWNPRWTTHRPSWSARFCFCLNTTAVATVVENFIFGTPGPSGRPVFQKERFPPQWRELWWNPKWTTHRPSWTARFCFCLNTTAVATAVENVPFGTPGPSWRPVFQK